MVWFNGVRLTWNQSFSSLDTTGSESPKLLLKLMDLKVFMRKEITCGWDFFASFKKKGS